MKVTSLTEAAAFLTDYAGRLQRAVGEKWTGEMATGVDIEARLLAISAHLKRGATATPGFDWALEADFVQSQAALLRSPNQLILDDPLTTVEWRTESELALRTADTLEVISGMLRTLGK